MPRTMRKGGERRRKGRYRPDLCPGGLRGRNFHSPSLSFSLSFSFAGSACRARRGKLAALPRKRGRGGRRAGSAAGTRQAVMRRAAPETGSKGNGPGQGPLVGRPRRQGCRRRSAGAARRGPGFFCLLPALSRAFFRKRGRGHFPFSESGLCSEKKEFAHEHADTPADCCRAG